MRDSEKIQIAKNYYNITGIDAEKKYVALTQYGMSILRLGEYEAGLTEPDDNFYLWAYNNAMPICVNCAFWRDKAWTWKGWGICDNPANSVRNFARAMIEKFCIPDEEIKHQILQSIRYPEDFGCRFFKRRLQLESFVHTVTNLNDLEEIEAAKLDYDSSFGVGRGMVIAKTMIHTEYASAVLKLEPEDAFAYARKAVLQDDFDQDAFYSWYYSTYMDGQPE